MENTMSTTQNVRSLPSDCSENIFSYLELKDCLKFGSTSSQSMKQILPNLNRRRMRMKQRFAYKDWKNLKGPINHKIVLLQEQSCPLNWVSLPTVQERIDQLVKKMPVTHPLRAMVKSISDDLREDVDMNKMINIKSTDFEEVFSFVKKVVKALKLYAKVLSTATHSNPMQGKNETSLDQYIGDVLVIAYLMSMRDLGIVEAGPTNISFVRELRKHKSSDSTCYLEFVHLHSSILRVKTFTREQCFRLGISEELCQLSDMIPNDCYINQRFLSSELTLAFYQFGRLGPAFRGRDIIQQHEIPARCLFAFFATDNVHLDGETVRSAMDWLFLAHEQSRKARPMTVVPPFIRLCRSQVA